MQETISDRDLIATANPHLHSTLNTFPLADAEDTFGLQTQSEPQPYHCCAEYHLAPLAPAAAYIHPFALRISQSNSGLFYCSAVKLAGFFKCNERTIRRGFDALTELGFLELLDKHLYAASVYKVLNHTEWAKRHPGQCCEKLEYVWSGEGDKLGHYIHGRTGGKVKLIEFQMRTIRKFGLGDEEIEGLFDEFYSARLNKNHAIRVIPSFIVWLGKRTKTTGVGGQICPAVGGQI